MKNEKKDDQGADAAAVATAGQAVPAAELSHVAPLSPPLKWAGGKRWQVPYLRPLWVASGAQRLVEPFCGGLSVALGLQPARALLNDINPHLMNFYQCLKAGVLGYVPTANERAQFDLHRERFNVLARGGHHTPESAALFYYLNKTGFNGLCRFNRKGEFNVPFGKFKTITYARDWWAYTRQFAHWDFTCGDFGAVPLRSGDFVYADPPYDVEFTTYSAGGFKWDDQVRAATWLARHDGPVVLVNQQTARIDELYRDLRFEIGYLDAPRRISCNGDRTPAKEVFATRNLVTSAALHVRAFTLTRDVA